MKLLKDSFLLLVGVLVIAWSFITFLHQPAPEHFQTPPILKVGEHNIILEIADTDAKRTQGLSGRTALENNHGMLFIFEEPGKYGFWMKDMLFPIDIVWISADLQVVGVERNVLPESYPQIFYPQTLINYALELNSGEAERLGIDIGEKLYLTH